MIAHRAGPTRKTAMGAPKHLNFRDLPLPIKRGNGFMDGQTDQFTNQPTDGSTDRLTDGPTDGPTNM